MPSNSITPYTWNVSGPRWRLPLDGDGIDPSIRPIVPERRLPTSQCGYGPPCNCRHVLRGVEVMKMIFVAGLAAVLLGIGAGGASSYNCSPDSPCPAPCSPGYHCMQ